jgi:hypothetical protein
MKKSEKKRPREVPREQRQQSHLLYIVLLALLAFAVYSNSLSNGFVGDDQDQLLRNPLVSGHRIAAAFGSGVWAFRGVQGNYYRPLQFVIYSLVHALAGFQPFVYHLLFALLHALTTIAVYFLAERLTGRQRAALAAAALFAVHPIHTEVVDWIASLPDLMMTAIVVFAVWRFASQGGSPRGRQIAAHCLLYLAALGSKETGIMLLPLFIGFERICLARTLREVRRNVALYAGLAATLAVYLAARWAALGGLAPAQQTFYHLGATEFLLSAVVIAAEYLGKLVLPLGLNYFHIFEPTRGVTLQLAVSVLALVAVAWVALRRSTRPPISYGILWIALTIAPALHLTGVGQNVFAERYLYLPSVGFVWIAGMLWDWWAARHAQLAWTAGFALLFAAAWQTVTRNPDWRDDFTLLRQTIAQSPAAGILHNNLAGVYVDRNDLPQALNEERLAVQLEPNSAPFHKNLGLILMARDPRAAAVEFAAALQLQPSDGQLRQLLEEANLAAANR